ncbi:MAG: hydroxymethylglutaryl-CoA lyase [Desulfatitalea sp.]|nr:hydroxymethylglutaryl-CoA lyase [Desulfatitalea sp.]MBI5895772.1 hydroxymethylglutaryl-CoA lyase [Desulfobacterales bacterium]
MHFPPAVSITEVGPRDGLQMEARVLPTAEKLDLIAGLALAGLKAIQVTAFVHPEKVPAMADAEALIAALPMTDKEMDYSALTLNLQGVARACRSAIPWIEISLSAHEGHSRRNAGRSTSQALAQSGPMTAMAIGAGRKVRASIQCAFGYEDPGDVGIDAVAALAARLVGQGADLLVLADTTGLAAPPTVRRMLAAVAPVAGPVPMGLHFHDTRGLGLANVVTALEMGISHFDTSLGGLGGCPFIEGAAGNIATEDALYLFHRLGIETGIDIGRIAGWSRRLSDFFGRPLPGKIYRLA